MNNSLTRIWVLCGACAQRGQLCGEDMVFATEASSDICVWEVFGGWSVVRDFLHPLAFGLHTLGGSSEAQGVSWQQDQILPETCQSSPSVLSQRSHLALLGKVVEASEP